MAVVERPDNRAVCPCLDPVIEEGNSLPREMPRLAVVNELLKLPRGHGSMLLQDVRRYIVRRGHGRALLLGKSIGRSGCQREYRLLRDSQTDPQPTAADATYSPF